MLRTYLFLLIFFFIGHIGFAQRSVGGEPYSFRTEKFNYDLETQIVAKPDMRLIQIEDEQREADKQLEMSGRIIDVDLDLNNSGSWTELSNGDRIWRLAITAPDALAMELFYDEFFLPSGGVLHIYDPSKQQLIGGFTSYNNHESGLFTTDLIVGTTCILEYYEPATVSGSGTIHISGLGYSYKMVPGMGGAKAQECEVDVNCSPEGDDWTDQRNSVVRVRIVDSGSVGWCSGTVMNNTDQDCTPYILTAFHCGETSSTADFLQWKFYFNYQRPACETGTAFANKVLTGCLHKADSNDGGGDSGSDFLLVEIDESIPTWWGPYYAGWDATGNGDNNGVCIHQPAGDEKKISTYTSNLLSATWNSASGAHWRAVWSATLNGHGVTEGGSSGSPIFNSNKRLIGTLTGGLSFCNTVVPGGQLQPDYFGKMSWHWDGNVNPTADLKDFLDPGNGGAVTYDGAFNPCNFVGIEENDINELSIYPNPSNGIFNISLSTVGNAVDRVEVYDALGSVVWVGTNSSTELLEVDLSKYENGSYLITIWTNAGQRITKPVVLLK